MKQDVQFNCTPTVLIVGTNMILRQFLHADSVAASTLLRCGGTSAAGPVGTIPLYLATASAKEDAPKQIMAADTLPLPPRAAQTRTVHAGQAAAAQ